MAKANSEAELIARKARMRVLRDAGMSFSEIGKEVGCTGPWVYYCLEGRSRGPKNRRKMVAADIARVVRDPESCIRPLTAFEKMTGRRKREPQPIPEQCFIPAS